MIALFPFDVDFTIRCSYCSTMAFGAQAHLAAVRMKLGDAIPHPTLPQGWRIVDTDKLACPRHTITVENK